MTARLRAFGDFSGTNTAGADNHSPRFPVYVGSHGLEIRQPPHLVDVMGMAYGVSRLWFLSADLAYSGQKIHPLAFI